MSIYLHPFAATMWAIQILAMYGLAWIAWFRPGQRHQNLFAYYCSYSAASSSLLFLFSALRDPVDYTWVYGVSEPTKNILAIAAVGKCVWAVTRKRLVTVGGWGTLALDFAPYVISSVFLLYFFPPADSDLWLSLEWTLILLCGGFLWVISFASDSWRLQWRTREYGIGAGFLWLCSIRFFVESLRIVIFRESAPSTYWLNACTNLVAALIWIRFFIKKEPEIKPLSLQQLTEASELLYSFKKIPVQSCQTQTLTGRQRRA